MDGESEPLVLAGEPTPPGSAANPQLKSLIGGLGMIPTYLSRPKQIWLKNGTYVALSYKRFILIHSFTHTSGWLLPCKGLPGPLGNI